MVSLFWLAPLLAVQVAAQRSVASGSSVDGQESAGGDLCRLTEVAKLAPGEADVFGIPALFEDTALIPASSRVSAGSRAAFAYVFERRGGGWDVLAKLTPSDAGLDDCFGWGRALTRDTALIGAWCADAVAPLSGAAYVFTRVGTAWTEQKLVANDGGTQDFFGWAVALSADTALVGAYWNGEAAHRSGAVYVFERSGTTWAQETKLFASDADGDEHFGRAVALSGDTALIGAPHETTQIVDEGAAYVFVREGSVWSAQAKLTASDPDWEELFGSAVALDGDTALVGAICPGNPPCSTGLAYVFVRSGTDWTQQAKLRPSDGEPCDWFGGSVSLLGDLALIGAAGDDDAGTNSGSVYVFERVGERWFERAKLQASDAEAKDTISTASLWGRSALVGTSRDGEVYEFDLAPLYAQTYCTAKSSSLGCTARIDQLGCSSASESSGFSVFASGVRNRKAGLLAYGLDGPAALPYQGGFLCMAAPVHRTPARSSGGHLKPVHDCSGVYRIDMNAFAAGVVGGTPRPELRVPGTQVQCQWWARDPDDPFGTWLSNALEYTVRP